jgi:hypothetical protein
MAKKPIVIILLIFLLVPAVFAVKKDSTKVSLNRYSLAIGMGWSHYINTLEVGTDQAKTNFVGVSLKFFWEPEHRLSLGLETGMYRLYKGQSKNYEVDKGEVSMSVIPLLLNIRMRIVDHLYLSTGAGLAIMINKVAAYDTKLTNNILSLSNYQFSGSYIYPLDKHWQVGGELKVLNFGKTADWMYTIQAVCAVKL